jgi:hypothetical protein
VSIEPGIIRDEDRASKLKSATRLGGPLGGYVVYDRDGHLGIRFLSPWAGPTETGVEYDYNNPDKLNNETPWECFKRTQRAALPDRSCCTIGGPLTDICDRRDPHWAIGSRRDFQGDLLAIVRNAADCFGVDLVDNTFMFYVRAGFDVIEPKLCIQPSEFFHPRGVKNLTYGVLGWLLEDLMRLETGLFRRNRPVGCCGYTSAGVHEHRHQPVRFSVITYFQGSGHEMLEFCDRYPAIVAASNFG